MISTCVLDLVPQATLEPAHGPPQQLQQLDLALPAVSCLRCPELARGSLETQLEPQLPPRLTPRQQDARDPRCSKQTEQRKVEDSRYRMKLYIPSYIITSSFPSSVFIQQNINVFRFFSYLLFSNSTLFDPKIFSD